MGGKEWELNGVGGGKESRIAWNHTEAGEMGWEEYSDFISHGTSFCLFGKILHP